MSRTLRNLQSKEPTSRKTVLSGLVVLTDNDIYRSEMLKDIKAHQRKIDTQQMSAKQLKNNVTQEKVSRKIREL